MSAIAVIIAPPQTLESLQNWGNLDHLPFPLDSAVWNSAGIYGLALAENAQSGETAVFVLAKTDAITGHVVTSQTLSGQTRLRLGSFAGTAETAESFQGNGRYLATFASAAQSGQSALFVRTRSDAVTASAGTSQTILPERCRTNIFTAASETAQNMRTFRLRLEIFAEAMQSGQFFSGNIKGHNWRSNAGSNTAEWAEIDASNAVWQTQGKNSANWTGRTAAETQWQQKEAAGQPWGRV